MAAQAKRRAIASLASFLGNFSEICQQLNENLICSLLIVTQFLAFVSLARPLPSSQTLSVTLSSYTVVTLQFTKHIYLNMYIYYLHF